MRRYAAFGLALLTACARDLPPDPGWVEAQERNAREGLQPIPHVEVPPEQLARVRAEHEQAARDAAEAAAYCRFAGTMAGGGNPVLGYSIVAEVRAADACMAYYRTTGRPPGRP